MARRRPSRASLNHKTRKTPKPFVCEALEERLQFVVLHGGDAFTFSTGGAAGGGGTGGGTGWVRVVVTGNTTVELVGALVNTTSGQLENGAEPNSDPRFATPLTTMDGFITGTDAGQVGYGYISKLATVPPDVESIYAIYVVQSDSTSGIAVASITDPTTPGPHPMLPYSGQTTLRIVPTGISNPNQATYLVTGPANGGANVLGALTLNPTGTGAAGAQNEDSIPILTAPVTAGEFTYVPAGNLTPGLTVTSGNFGSFLFSGTITGDVTIHGSINQFYAGWIVTGNSDGETDDSVTVSVPDNFQVDGDLRDLISPGSLGTDDSNAALVAAGTPRYSSGFDMHVGGRVGQINTQGNFVGSLTVANDNPAAGLAAGTPETEVEDRGPAAMDFWDSGILGTPSGGTTAGFLDNDTYATPQYVGSDSNGNILISGTLQATVTIADYVDYYAVPLLAGQTVTVQVVEPTTPPILDAGVFDPDGRLIASDFSRTDPTQTEEQPFQFTATEPGVYRFAVATDTNPNFDAGGGNPITRGTFPYTLSIQNVGNLAIGGLVAGGVILDNPNLAIADVGVINSGNSFYGLHVLNGDFGAAVAGNEVITEFDETDFGIYSFAVDNGNIRVVQGTTIGHLTAGGTAGGAGSNPTGPTYGDMPSVFAPLGSVGLLRATGGLLAWNQFVPADTELTTAQSTAFSIGGDYQWVDAPNGTVAADLIAQGNIGSIDASDMGTDLPSYFQVNAANNPSVHGTIDLIDVTNNVGLLGAGGPGITTGPGGNVRYFVVSPSTGIVYRDAFFGGGQPETTLYQPGESAVITDDSGTVVTLTPVGGTPVVTTTGTGATATTTVTYSAPASLTVTTYPIRGSGGAAIVKVESTDSLSVSASGAGGAQSAEIGTIQLDGTGTLVTNNNASQTGGTTGTGTGTGTGTVAGQPGGPPIKTKASNGPYTLPTLPTIPSLSTVVPLTLDYSGNVKIDTWMVTGPQAADTSLSNLTGTNITSLTNSTGGEIVNIKATSLGTVTSNGAIGLPVEQNTASAVLGHIVTPVTEDTGNGAEPWTYPFLDPRSMVRVLQNIVSISAGGGLGNIYAGQVLSPGGTVTGTPAVGTGAITGGTDGNIGSLAGPVIGPIVAAGSIGSVTADGGFAPHGSGAVGGPGVYAVGLIGPIVSIGDMRGEIVSTTGQISLTVSDGSIAEATIGNLGEFDYAEARAGAVTIQSFQTSITKPTVDIGSITVTGNGGIIGTQILADHIGTISVASTGFGMFDTTIDLRGDGTLSTLSVGGYGIRDGTLDGGANFGSITVHGNGANLPVTDFPASVRQSETGAQFTSSGTPISFLNDIDSFLGTNASTPSIIGITDSGVIEDFTVLGSRNLGSVTAYSIRGRDLTTLTSVVKGFVPALTASVTTFNVANAINNLTVTGPVNGFDLTTGRTSKYNFGGDVSNMDMTVAGPINSLILKSSFEDNSSINAVGPSGHIGSLTIDGNLAGTVSATTYIQMLHVLGSITGTVTATRIGTIHVAGPVGTGGLTVNGPLTNLIVDGTFGPSGNPIVVNGNAGTIRIKGDLAANVKVTGNLKQFIVNGNVLTNSDSTIGGILNLLQVGGDVQAGATITAALIKRQVVKGQILGTIVP